MIRSLAGLAAANLVLIVLGAGILLAFGTWARTTPLARPVFALFAGLAGFVALVPPLLYAGLSPTPPVVGVLSLAVLALGVLLHRRGGGAGPRDPGGGGSLLAAAAAVPLALLGVRAVFKPLWVGDAFLDWTLKAKMLFGHGGAVRGALDERFFTSDAYGFAHLEYPLGLPALEAFAFHSMGVIDTRVLHVQFVVLLAAFVAALWVLLRPQVDPVLLGAGLFLILMTQAIHIRLLTAYADIPLAVFWVAAAVALGLWVRGDGRDRLLLGALFAAAALATKQDGMVFCFVLFAATGVALALARDWRRLRELAIAGAVVVATAIPWQVYAQTRGLRNPAFEPSPGSVVDRLDDLPEIAWSLAKASVASDWLYVVPIALAAAAVLLVRGARGLAAAYLLTTLGLYAGLALVYLTTEPGRDLTVLLGQSAGRVASTPILFAAALLPLLLAEALAPRAAGGREADETVRE